MRAAVAAMLAAAVLAGCAAVTRQTSGPAPAAAPAQPRPGAYYKDDGPGPNPPADLASIPDAVPRPEPLHRFANRPYQVFGKEYVPLTSIGPFSESGLGSWYGRRYHGSATSSGEKYDMYAMTAAHPTLPIPSYVRVTNPANGRSVVVRINDRGPFLSGRIVDLSYTAAWKLGYVEAGSTLVEVESIVPGIVADAPVVQQPAIPVAPAVARPSEPPAAKGIYLQLGAFSGREGAESFRARIYRDLAWLTDVIRIVAAEGLQRLFLGPYRSQDEARAIADRIQAEISLRPLTVTR